MQSWIQKYVTTEGVFALLGGLWFVVSAIFPTIPSTMPAGLPIPGFENLSISPGLFVAVAFVPILLKTFIPGKTPFIGTGKSVTVTSAPVEVKENQDA